MNVVEFQCEFCNFFETALDVIRLSMFLRQRRIIERC